MDKNIKLRAAKKEDLSDLWALSLIVFPEVKGSSFEEFADLWRYRWESPFRSEKDLLGWVLENEQQEVKGFISYIPLMLRAGEDLYPANSVSTWVVDPSASSNSLDLFRAFGKRDADVWLLDTTANKIASLMCKRLKMAPVAIVGYQRKFIWIVDTYAFLKSRSAKLFATPVGRIVAFLLSIILRLKGHMITAPAKDFSLHSVEKFGEEYDRFWDQIKKDMGITHERTKEFMNWRHFNLPKLKGKACSFVCKDKNGEILGYLMLKTCGRGEGGEKRMIITDLLFISGRIDVYQFLVRSAYQIAKEKSMAILEVFGYRAELMNELLDYKPIIRSFDHMTYWSKSPNNILPNKSVWVSGIDGDMNL
ncbi:MAG: hypothetical protein ABIH50_00435 [bacterium]